jgi:hypothetical protein
LLWVPGCTVQSWEFARRCNHSRCPVQELFQKRRVCSSRWRCAKKRFSCSFSSFVKLSSFNLFYCRRNAPWSVLNTRTRHCSRPIVIDLLHTYCYFLTLVGQCKARIMLSLTIHIQRFAVHSQSQRSGVTYKLYNKRK